MGYLVATVTRLARSDTPFFARMAGGGLAGSFKNLADAKTNIQRTVGGKALKWLREDLVGSIESYAAYGTDFLPTDFSGLQQWQDSSQGISIANNVTNQASTWGDYSKTGNPMLQYTAGLQPVLNDTSGPGGKPQLLFGATGIDEFMQATIAVTPPYTYSVVAQAPVIPSPLFQVLVEFAAVGVTRMQIGSGAGVTNWVVDNGDPIVGPAMTPSQSGMVTVVQRTAGADYYFNGVLVASNALVPAAADTIRFGLPVGIGAAVRWGGGISSSILYSRALPSNELSQLHSYSIARFALP